MKKGVVVGFSIGVVVIIGYWMFITRQSSPIISPIEKVIERPLDKYTIENLGNRTYEGSDIVLDEMVATTSAYTVRRFHFFTDDPTSSLDKSSGLHGVKRVNGLAHIPRHDTGLSAVALAKEENQAIKVDQKFPVIVQFRGYVDPAIYQPGIGTKRSAEVFATNGFLSLAPDFLGYGGSDNPSIDVFEERFQNYTTALNLLASIKTIPFADPDRVGIWGHSNGGQIALTVLEISQKPYPATLWAPVTKPFPYSILYFTDDIPDHGKALRKKVAEFEALYDAELYSLPNYLDRIKGPMQLHQGTADDAVPKALSDHFIKECTVDSAKCTIDYFVYPGADHNMSGAWDRVVARDIEFFRTTLK